MKFRRFKHPVCQSRINGSYFLARNFTLMLIASTVVQLSAQVCDTLSTHHMELITWSHGHIGCLLD